VEQQVSIRGRTVFHRQMRAQTFHGLCHAEDAHGALRAPLSRTCVVCIFLLSHRN